MSSNESSGVSSHVAKQHLTTHGVVVFDPNMSLTAGSDCKMTPAAADSLVCNPAAFRSVR